MRPKGQRKCYERKGKMRKRILRKKKKKEDFSGGPVVKNPPANAGATCLIPGPGRSHMPQASVGELLRVTTTESQSTRSTAGAVAAVRNPAHCN